MSVGEAVIDIAGLHRLVEVLAERGYTVVGPTVQDNAIVLAELTSAADLPHGVGVTVSAGSYRLRQRDDGAAFGHSAGPQSWKTYLHPARVKLWSVDRSGDAPVTLANDGPGGPYAFLGVRPCDLRAIRVVDDVLGGKLGRRCAGVFVVAVECTEPGDTCFCSSMSTGPGVRNGYDLALTELIDETGHRFLVRVGSDAGAEVLASLPHQPADKQIRTTARQAVDDAAARMGRAMPDVNLRELLVGARESPHWEDVASRCITCGNCTLVCPTCYCTTTEDVTDLTGEHAERWRRWDSCFDLDFSYLHGGSVRTSGASRYRQWLTHKLSTWHDQFGSSGCVGCGRCIVWCPVGIDITAEVDALATVAEAGGG